MPSAFYRCPSCHTALEAPGGEHACPGCRRALRQIEGIPLLVDDFEAIERAIAAAREGASGSWYEDSQEVQFTGPYRHHLAKRRAYLEELLGRMGIGPGSTGRAVDLGCGDGVNLAWLADRASEVYGSDYNIDRLVRAARSVAPGRVFLADATNYPVVDEALDLVFMNHVLEHIPDDGRALEEVHRILKPGGTAIIGVPNEGALWWRLAYRLEPSSRESTDHVHFYTAESIVARCRRAGFRVHEVEAMGWGPPCWSLDARIRGRRWVDDVFEAIGRRVIPKQASSLYVALTK